MDILIAFLLSMAIIWGGAVTLYFLYALMYLPRYFFDKHYRKN